MGCWLVGGAEGRNGCDPFACGGVEDIEMSVDDLEVFLELTHGVSELIALVVVGVEGSDVVSVRGVGEYVVFHWIVVQVSGWGCV